MRWTSNTTDGTFRISYNPGTHQLTATNNATHSTQILGRYDDVASVDRALEGWADRHNDEGGQSPPPTRVTTHTTTDRTHRSTPAT